MLDWTLRWGIPLMLVVLGVVFADGRMSDPTSASQHALESLRNALLGLIPRFF